MICARSDHGASYEFGDDFHNEFGIIIESPSLTDVIMTGYAVVWAPLGEARREIPCPPAGFEASAPGDRDELVWFHF
jgi:hypothetical protein